MYFNGKYVRSQKHGAPTSDPHQHDKLNPFMPNVFYHPYQLEESISNVRVVGWYLSFFIQI